MSTGKAVFDLGLAHVGESYVAGIQVPMNDTNWQGPWDCAELASWLVYQTSGLLYGTRTREDNRFADAFTGYWAAQAQWDNATVDVEDAAQILGAFILRKPRPGKRGHIVISHGEGGTLEAHSRKRGVVLESLAGRCFDFGILVPGIAYAGVTRVCEELEMLRDAS